MEQHVDEVAWLFSGLGNLNMQWIPQVVMANDSLGPLRLERAGQYLRTLVSNNEAKTWPDPPALRFIKDAPDHTIKQDLPMPPGWSNFAPAPPRVIAITAIHGKKRKPTENPNEAGDVDEPADEQAPVAPTDGPAPAAEAKAKAMPGRRWQRHSLDDTRGDEVRGNPAPAAPVDEPAPAQAKAKAGRKAKAKPAPKPKPNAKAAAAAKAAAKAQAMPPPVQALGCSKCRFKVNGCGRCRNRS